ncbi:hypothetical protein LSH36_1049g00092 [Paralvinella palmiformis]|uniref:Uncharacterized protein n=1 Tax=Paralvinella palmiformis TaxID=53620 RepID=A0AAD9IVK0_9ANNE|nr:hypothetical protein LSH36_1049g00092 [Paralvinella palmiformis]
MCSRLSRKQRKKDELEKKLYFAISDNNVEALESLIKNGINVDTTFYGTNQLQKTAMHLCCEEGPPRMCEVTVRCWCFY